MADMLLSEDRYWPKNPPSSRIARMRRGKYVPIPSEWRGKITTKQTIRKRQSKKPRRGRPKQRLQTHET